jgi:hypothetical protein
VPGWHRLTSRTKTSSSLKRFCHAATLSDRIDIPISFPISLNAHLMGVFFVFCFPKGFFLLVVELNVNVPQSCSRTSSWYLVHLLKDHDWGTLSTIRLELSGTARSFVVVLSVFSTRFCPNALPAITYPFRRRCPWVLVL